MLDRQTVQWTINRISALIEKRMTAGNRKSHNRTDETIAATARYIAKEYAHVLKEGE